MPPNLNDEAFAVRFPFEHDIVRGFFGVPESCNPEVEIGLVGKAAWSATRGRDDVGFGVSNAPRVLLVHIAAIGDQLSIRRPSNGRFLTLRQTLELPSLTLEIDPVELCVGGLGERPLRSSVYNY